MGDLLGAIDAIRQAVDFGANIGWFVAHNVQIVSEALHAFIFRTASRCGPTNGAWKRWRMSMRRSS